MNESVVLMITWPTWAVVIACGIAAQLVKFTTYSLTGRRLAVSMLVQSRGLPSLPTAVLSCLLVLTGMREGWSTGETGFALVFMVIVVHDTVKLRVAATRHREVLYWLVESLDDAGPFHQRVAGYLDSREHHPAHVGIGCLFGILFGLAFGVSGG